MRTESNREPEPIEIRKLGVTDDTPVVYLYLNTDIKQETALDIDDKPATKYMYDMTQITVPTPEPLLDNIDTTHVAEHGYNQTHVKQQAAQHLDTIKKIIDETPRNTVKHVDRLDKLTEITDIDLEKCHKLTTKDDRRTKGNDIK